MGSDVRWEQRFGNYNKALDQLIAGVELMRQRALSDLEKQGLIQAFEYTYELGWNVLKDYLLWQGVTEIVGSRDAIRESYNKQLIVDGEIWMNMLQDRNRTTHTYNRDTAESILQNINEQYYGAFLSLRNRFQQLASQ